MNVLCTICVRGGSKGVKNKNIKNLNGKPLIAWTINQAKESGLFEKIVISTDSEKIMKVAKEYGADVFFKREAKLATDTAGKLDVIKDAFLRSEEFYNKKFDYLIDLDATAPLRSVEDIKNAFNQFIKNNNDNLITATPSRKSPYFNMIEIVDNKIQLVKQAKFLRRQDTPKTYDMNASIYIWKREVLLNNNSIFLENTGLYVMDEMTAFDIDTEIDFKIVECLMKDKDAKR